LIRLQMVKSLTTAVLDKSVLQRIAELPVGDREEAWRELSGRFQLVIPFVLLEEVLTNLGQPRNTPPEVVEAMFVDLLNLQECWIADEIDWAFEELVLRKRSSEFKLVSKDFVQRMCRLKPWEAEYQQFLSLRRNDAADDLQRRMKLQNEAAEWRLKQKYSGESGFIDEHGRTFLLVSSEQAFFDKFVSPGFEARDRDDGWFEMLNYSLGPQMRARYAKRSDEIERALRTTTSKEVFESPGTLNCLLAKLFYFWAPVVRIGDDQRTGRKIIGRTRSDQRNNIHDERYVGPTLLCNVLLTRDRDMAQMAQCFSRSGLWKGRVIDLSALGDLDIRSQIASLPLPI